MATTTAIPASTTTRLTPVEVEAHLLDGRVRLIDARPLSTIEATGRIPASQHWAGQARPPATATATIVYSGDEASSRHAAEYLSALGIEHVHWLGGGFAAWRDAELPVAGLASWHVRPIPTLAFTESSAA